MAFAWNAIHLIENNLEANFARFMAPLYGHHFYKDAEMLAVICRYVHKFEIEVGERDKPVLVDDSNMKMTVFLLWRAVQRECSFAPGGSFRFSVTAEDVKAAWAFFGNQICHDATNPVMDTHTNLKKFLRRMQNKSVILYFAEAA